MEKNEWLRDSEGTRSNVGRSLKSRKNFEAESNPERNTHSLYRKEQPEGKKRMITILGDSMIKDLNIAISSKNFRITDSMSNLIRGPQLLAWPIIFSHLFNANGICFWFTAGPTP